MNDNFSKVQAFRLQLTRGSSLYSSRRNLILFLLALGPILIGGVLGVIGLTVNLLFLRLGSIQTVGLPIFSQIVMRTLIAQFS